MSFFNRREQAFFMNKIIDLIQFNFFDADIYSWTIPVFYKH